LSHTYLIVTDLQTQLNITIEQVNSVLLKFSSVIIPDLFINKIDIPFEPPNNLFLEHYRQGCYLIFPFCSLSDLLIDIAFLIVIKTPVLKPNHIQLIALNQYLISERRKGALLTKGEQVLRVGSVQQLVVEVLLVGKGKLEQGEYAVLQVLAVGETLGGLPGA